MARKYKASPIGISRYCWVNRPDTKYVSDGLYHTELILDGDEAKSFRKEVDDLVDAAWKEGTKDMKPAESKKWGKYFPYSVIEDEGGGETGQIAFKFKQNAKIRQPDGSMKTFPMGIRDSNNKATAIQVFGGSTIRVMWAPRDSKLATAKQWGVRLDFSMVQVIKPAEASGGFDTVEGGYVDDDADADSKGGTQATDADY